MLTFVAGLTLNSNLVALGALASLIALKRAFDRRESLARRWTVGARAETAVGGVLNELRNRGFTVMHDIAQRREGNIDHLVKGPTGVYLIETKSGRYELTDLKKAKRQAAKVARELGVWVTPVICRPGSKAFRHDGVFIVPRELVVAWIERRPAQN